MNPSELFEIWAPAQSTWSRWAKPVLFTAIGVAPPPMSSEPGSPPLNLRLPGRSVVVVDLPGVDSLKAGLALAEAGYQPVPLFNGAPGPTLTLGGSALIDVRPIVHWLERGAERLRGFPLAADACPAFLLDADRQAPQWRTAAPGRFDNRWLVFPQDFPSASFLLAQRIECAVLVQPSGRTQPLSDLAHVVLRWQEAGIEVQVLDPDAGGAGQPIQVARPSRFRSSWYRALALIGLRRNSAGGFGSVIPEPSSSG